MANDKVPQFSPIGQAGISFAVENGVIVLQIDASEKAVKGARPSASGKTRMVATTGGFVPVPGTTVKISINVTAPNPK